MYKEIIIKGKVIGISDNNNNKVFFDFSNGKKNAIFMLKSLVRCKGCINCVNLKCCFKCIACSDCEYSSYCCNCNFCNNCKHCKQCEYCYECKYIIDGSTLTSNRA